MRDRAPRGQPNVSPSTAEPLAATDEPWRARVRRWLQLSRHSLRALRLVWSSHPSIAVWNGLLSLLAGLLPAMIAVVGKLIVDAVVAASESSQPDPWLALRYVGFELGLVATLALVQRGLGMCESLLRALLGHHVNELILQKALTLSLAQFEDSEFYDRMTRARREASSRPLSLVQRVFGLVQNVVSLTAYGGLLLSFSPLAVGILVLAALPIFWAETRFSDDAFRLFRWQAPETRQQAYLESLLAREDHAKEVKLFGLGPIFLARYQQIFERLFAADRALTLRRGIWGFGLGMLSTAAFYGAYAWIVASAVTGRITLGDMTMYLLLFKQGQAALASILSAVGGLYEDNLYLSNLFEYLDQQSLVTGGTAALGPDPADGVRFDQVSFQYPGASQPALEDISLHIPPGGKLALVGENGSGKTTLIKLLTGLYQPSSGRILFDGLDARQWDPETLRCRIGVIFQDFIRYQLLAGENIGAGDVDHFDDRKHWARAAKMGLAETFLERLPKQYDTQLGRWFRDGQELSLGQWQKMALSRAFMRQNANILVLDEPTASMDAQAEAEVFQRFRDLARDRIGIVISHRFSTVRMADQIAVLEGGKVVERGSHEQLMTLNGRYAHLFLLQAAGYR